MPHHPKPAFRGSAHSADRSPTPYADLNAVLGELVDSLRALLGDNLVGVYLQGSLAIGDFDAASDVDFIVVTRRDILQAELPALQDLHAAVHALPGSWAKHLDGSYYPQGVLRRLKPEPRDPPDEPPRPSDWADPGTSGRPPRVYPLLYLDNGSDRLERSEHDNTQVVRWTLRERGVRLHGPNPRALIDPVTPAMLRAEISETIAYVAQLIAADPDQLKDSGLRRFFVLLAARALQTLASGAIKSKRASALWAMETLEPRWRGLIVDACAGRWGIETNPPPLEATVAGETRAFVDEAAKRFATPSPADQARSILERRLAAQRQAPVKGLPNLRGGPPPRGGPSGYRGPPPTRPGGRGRRG
jgi:hypothetical protein